MEIVPLAPDRFEAIVPPDCLDEFFAELARAGERLVDRVLWHVSSTATGGGVAEMLLVGALLPRSAFLPAQSQRELAAVLREA